MKLKVELEFQPMNCAPKGEDGNGPPDLILCVRQNPVAGREQYLFLTGTWCDDQGCWLGYGPSDDLDDDGAVVAFPVEPLFWAIEPVLEDTDFFVNCHSAAVSDVARVIR